MLFRPNAPRPPWFMSLLVLALALLPLWEAWAVASSGTIEAAHCNGTFAGSLCAFGQLVGAVLLGGSRAHVGYVVVAGGLGLLFVYMAWGLHRRYLAGAKSGKDA